jgi:ribosome biogenesis GTPase
VANVNQALVIFAVVKPQPNFNLLDRFLIMMQQQGLPCIICFNKLDIDEEGAGENYRQIYEKCGYRTLLVSASKEQGIDELKALLAGKTTTVAGPSGVGKSSLVNCFQDNTRMETGSISEKIDRGRHTTRHTELIAVAEDTYILDTPGFSSLGLFDLTKEELASFYPEFAQYEQYCRFAGCSHVSEPICGVRDAVEAGELPRMRYDNYRQLYEELKAGKRY